MSPGSRRRPISAIARQILGTLAVAAVCAAALPAAADEAPTEEVPIWVLPAIPGAPAPPPLTLREEVCDARQKLTLAEKRREEAERIFRRARRRDYPRGVERQLLKEQRIRRRAEAREAEEALAATEERADDAPLSWQLLEPCPAPVPAKADPDADPDSPDAATSE